MCRKRTPLWPPEYTVDKVVEIPGAAFAAFMLQPLDRYEFIKQNAVTPFRNDCTTHCLLVMGEGCTDGVLVQCNSFGEASLMAYLAGARDIVSAELNRAGDFIVQEGTESTDNGWEMISFGKS